MLILLFLKGMVIGFTVGFLVNQMGLSGFALSFVSVMPQNIFLIPAFLILSAASVAFSLKLVRQQFLKSSGAYFCILLRYSGTMIAMICLVACAATVEAYVSPTLMKSVMALLNK